MPELSVVVPSHAPQSLVSAAVQSVLAQASVDLEIIVVDDASPERIDIRDPRVRVIRHQERRGAAAARNTGVQNARSTFVAFLDADDAWLPGIARAMVDALRAMESPVVGVTTGFILVHADGRTHVRDRDPRVGDVRETARGCTCAPGSTMAIQREAWLDLGGQDSHMARLEDWEFLLRVAEHGLQFGYIGLPLASIRHSSPGPLPADVRSSCSYLLCKHRATFHTALRQARRSLIARAHYEYGLALLRHRSILRAIPWFLRAAVLDPVNWVRSLWCFSKRRLRWRS